MYHDGGFGRKNRIDRRAGPRYVDPMSRAAVIPDLSAERRWRIVLARDRRYDGAFVYAVRSTGIFCRPSCPSRRPRREQVTYFAAPQAAELAGFRPCRRCRPTEPRGADPRLALVHDVCRFLDAHPDEPARLTDLAARARTTPHRLLRAFRSVLGISPRDYHDARRLDLFKTRLKEKKHVSPALYDAGYSSPSRIYERAHAQLGMTPAAYRRGAPGTRITYAVAPCRLGLLVVAATARGICRVALGDRAAALEAGLRHEFPAAELQRDRGMLTAWVQEILRSVDGDPRPLDLPLDVRATAFQRRVWQALRKIPYGETRSYAQVARAIGHPSATRAVARACATNPAALVIPCHRVVRSDGEPGGYRWGVERKQALLEGERAAR